MHESGFSLIEILVAAFVAALLSTATIVLMTGGLHAYRVAGERVERILDLSAGLALMRADLAGVAPERRARAADGRPVPPVPKRGFGDERPVIALVRRGLGWEVPEGPRPGSDLSRVDYVLRDGTLLRRSHEPVDAIEEGGMSERVLLGGVQDFRVRYLGEAGWTPVWNSAVLPMALELSFDLPDFPGMRCVFAVGGLPGPRS